MGVLGDAENFTVFQSHQTRPEYDLVDGPIVTSFESLGILILWLSYISTFLS